MAITPPVTQTKISTAAWGIPITNEVNALRTLVDANVAALAALKLNAVTAVKAADTAGIASGAGAGFTCTLPNVTAGDLVVGLIVHNGSTVSAASAFMGTTWTGVTGQNTAGPQIATGAGVIYQAVFVGVGVASGGPVTLTYNNTQSNASAWLCIGQRSSITLLTL